MNIDANEYNKSNESQVRDGKALIDTIVSQNPNEDYDIILDIGCGTGNVTKLLADVFKVKQIIGIDVDKQMIDFANENNCNQIITYYVQDFGLTWDGLSPQMRELEGKVLLKTCGKIYVNIGWNSDLYMNSRMNEMTELDVWEDLFNSHNFQIISHEFCLKDNVYELNAFKQTVITCNKFVDKTDKEFLDEYLSVHNKYRAKHKSPALAMDSKLVKESKSRCLDYGKGMESVVPSNNYTENFGAVSGQDKSAPCTLMVDMWVRIKQGSIGARSTPPSTIKMAPVMNEATGEHRYATASDTSSGSPIRLSG
ncbi:unnamed protein product, partial [Oppiella nova]